MKHWAEKNQKQLTKKGKYMISSPYQLRSNKRQTARSLRSLKTQSFVFCREKPVQNWFSIAGNVPAMETCIRYAELGDIWVIIGIETAAISEVMPVRQVKLDNLQNHTVEKNHQPGPHNKRNILLIKGLAAQQHSHEISNPVHDETWAGQFNRHQ